MTPLDDCCWRCECGRVVCRDDDDTCPDCAAETTTAGAA